MEEEGFAIGHARKGREKKKRRDKWSSSESNFDYKLSSTKVTEKGDYLKDSCFSYHKDIGSECDEVTVSRIREVASLGNYTH